MTITLEEVLKIQSHTYAQWRMFAFIIRKLSALPGVSYWVNDGNIYAERGTGANRPCVVSHMDTVHEIVEDLQIIKAGSRVTGFNSVTMKQTGIGGDDKVGVYITLKAIEKNENIKVVFFRDEECGCDGSGEADMFFFKDCGYVLQCDRQGNKDFVTTACGTKLSGKDFWKAVRPIAEGHGYDKCDQGGMTDVFELKIKGIEVAVANMSCGYYRPHSRDEYVDINDVRRCEGFVMRIIEVLGSRRFQHKAERYVPPVVKIDNSKLKGGSGYNHTKMLGRYDDQDDFYDRSNARAHSDHDKDTFCESCGNLTPADSLAHNRDYNLYVCPICVSWIEKERRVVA